MGEIHATAGTASAMERGIGRMHPQSAAERLHLAATPVFAVMAVLTAFGGNPADMLCSLGGHGMSPLGGMTLMYVLMSAFHAGPWLTRIARRRRAAAHNRYSAAGALRQPWCTDPPRRPSR